MESKIKILVVGDVRGKFKQLFQRVDTTNKKAGPFDCCFCVGDFFGSDEQYAELNAYKNGNVPISVPTYVLGPNDEEQAKFYQDFKDGELCPNLTFLGKRGLYTLSSGVKVAYLSGLEAPSATFPSTKEHYFNKEDVLALRNNCIVNNNALQDYRGVDLLLTSQWPFGIDREVENSSKLVSFLCKEIKPRYHFCGRGNKFLEYAPFRMPSDQITELKLCTRFIALAEVGNPRKDKWLYALGVCPVEKMRMIEILQKTTDEVNCPFLDVDFNECKVQKESSQKQQFFYDMDSLGSRHGKRAGAPGQHNRQDKRPRYQHIEQEKCWFCLSSPDVEKHLVITIGESFYLALAKGPINAYHVLIMSITHIPAAALLTEDDWHELERFKNALRDFFRDEGQVVCFTERHYKSSHLQINALGIDKGYSWKISHAFEDKSEEYNISFESMPELISPGMLPQKGPYFVAELPEGKTLITRQMKHFPLHFARDVFCMENLLNCEEKVDWKECTLDRETEIQMVQTFRKKFAKYDFTNAL